MKILFLLLFLICAFRVSAQTLVADYQFNNTLASSVSGAPVLQNLDGSTPNAFADDTVDGNVRRTLRFGTNGGLRLPNTNTIISSTQYTLVALFKFDDYTDYKRVVDFRNGTSQTGGYLYNGRLEGEDTSNVPIRPNDYVQVVLTRDASGNVKIYRDNFLVVSLVDSAQNYTISSNILKFAQDDDVVPNQASSGNIARIQIWNGVLSAISIFGLQRFPASVGDVRGRLVDANGKPVRQTIITFTDTATGESRSTTPNPFGYFNFLKVFLVKSYRVTVQRKGVIKGYGTFISESPFVPVTITY